MFLEFVERARPIVLQQARHRAVGKKASVGLAGRAVVALVLRIHDALNGRSTHRARQSVSSVNSHLGTKRGDLGWKLVRSLSSEPVGPLYESDLHGIVQPANFSVGQPGGELHRRE